MDCVSLRPKIRTLATTLLAVFKPLEKLCYSGEAPETSSVLSVVLITNYITIKLIKVSVVYTHVWLLHKMIVNLCVFILRRKYKNTGHENYV